MTIAREEQSIASLSAAPLGLSGPFWIVLLAYAGTNAIVYAFNGVQSGGDTERYLEGARFLQQGLSLEARHLPYTGFIFLLFVLFKVSSSATVGLVLFQLALGVLSCAALVSLGNRIGGRHAGLVCALLYAANPDIQIWNFYLLTDSIYISLLIGSVWLTAFFLDRLPRRGLLLAAVLGFPLATIRPDGWAFAPAAVLSVCSARLQSAMARIGLTIGLAIVVGIVFMSSPVTRAVVDQFLKIERFADGTVVFTSKQWRLAMPEAPVATGTQAAKVSAYVLQHPLECAELVAARVLAELIHVRPHFSAWHNAFIVFYLLPTYVFTAIGFAGTHHRTLRTFVVMLALGHLVMPAALWADWDGRFLLHFIPTLFPFAAAGFSHLVSTRPQ